MAFVSLVRPVFALPELLIPEFPAFGVPPLALFSGIVPVVPMGPPAGFCVPAAVAGFGDDVFGGVPCAKAALDAARVSAAIKVEVLVMVSLR